MVIPLIVGISMMAASHSGPIFVAGPTALELGGYVPVSQAAPAYANPGDTITVSVQLAAVHNYAVVMTVSTDSPSMFESLPSQFTVPAGSKVGSFQATISESAGGYVTLTSSDAAGSLTSVTDVVDSLHRRVSLLGL